jgi:hypothetical protein
MKEQRGVSIIAAVFIIVILAFMGVIFVTLIGSGSLTAVNDLQSAQALSIAEGGVEFDQRSLAQNLDWYRSMADPIAVTTRSLGAGSFTVSTTLPATKLRRRLQAGDTTAVVYSTGRFPGSGFLQIEDDITGNAEFVRYTGIAGNTFTGMTRNVTIGTVIGSAGPHSRGDRVYPVTTLIDAMPNDCNAMASLRVAAHSKLLGAGTLDVEGEEILYTGSRVSGGTMTLTGVSRCQNGTASALHPSGRPVTPLLDDGASPDAEAEIVSTGTAGSAVRVVNKTIQR